MLPAHFAEPELLGVAAQGCAIQIEGQVGIGALEEVHAVGLESGDNILRSAHQAFVEGVRYLIVVLEELVAEIDRPDVGARRQEGRRPLVETPVDGGEHRTDAAVAAAEVLGRADNRVVGRWRISSVARARLALGDRIEDADGGALRESRQQLAGAEDGDRLLRYGVSVYARQLGGAADASAIVE